MKKILNNLTYTISYEPVIEDVITPQLSAQLERGHHIALKGKQEGLKQLKKLIEQYPEVPQFKNYLTVWYQTRGNTEKAREINRQTLQKHPDYFFARVNLAYEYLEEGNLEKITELLGKGIDLKQMYPERDVFHITEVLPVFKIAILYFIKVKDFEQAEIRLNMLKEIDPDSEDIEEFQMMLMFAKMSESPLFNRKPGHVIETQPQPATSKRKPPVFYHSEIGRLYEPSDLTSQEIGELLALPKQTLVQDLETVLRDSIERFSFFEENGTDYRKTNFVLYSLILLRELRAEESLEAVLETLAQSEEYIGLYFGDFMTEFIWEVIFNLGKNRLNELTGFMKRPYVYTFSKSQVSSAVAQLAVYYPQRRQEVIGWFAQLFRYYAGADLEKGIIDDVLIGFMVCDVFDFCGKELKEGIRILFEKDYVDQSTCGDWKSVAQDLDDAVQEDKHSFTELSELLRMLENHDNDNQYDDYEEVNENPLFKPSFLNTSPAQRQKEPGRNAPCFCGSGKKYKKCCLGKP